MDHVRLLASHQPDWPPLLAATDGTVIDGVHRYHAAQLLGLLTVPCEWFQGDVDDAFIEFVRRNVRHGLPLTLREREHAAVQLLHLRADWSDRRIADFCALAANTVRRLRVTVARPSVQTAGLDRRRGQDGRNRPVNPARLRRVICEAIRLDPEASSRTIARRVGSSPTTVGSVRAEMALADATEDGDTAPDTDHSDAAMLAYRVDPASGSESWKPRSALMTSTERCDFSEWFARTSIEDDWRGWVDTPPLGTIYELADEARRRAQRWTEFARAIEGRASEACRR
jgi:hypothetical protein